jgi:hypothetical protein
VIVVECLGFAIKRRFALTVARKSQMKKKKLKKVKPRIPVAPPGSRHKSKKDYKRNKK